MKNYLRTVIGGKSKYIVLSVAILCLFIGQWWILLVATAGVLGKKTYDYKKEQSTRGKEMYSGQEEEKKEEHKQEKGWYDKAREGLSDLFGKKQNSQSNPLHVSKEELQQVRGGKKQFERALSQHQQDEVVRKFGVLQEDAQKYVSCVMEKYKCGNLAEAMILACALAPMYEIKGILIDGKKARRELMNAQQELKQYLDVINNGIKELKVGYDEMGAQLHAMREGMLARDEERQKEMLARNEERQKEMLARDEERQKWIRGMHDDANQLLRYLEKKEAQEEQQISERRNSFQEMVGGGTQYTSYNFNDNQTGERRNSFQEMVGEPQYGNDYFQRMVHGNRRASQERPSQFNMNSVD